MNVKMRVVQGRPAGKVLVFPHGNYYFGRGAECHVRPNSEWVSRQHCLLRVTGEGVYLRDLGSRNGTLVNGSLLDGERPLGSGDKVQIGPLVFEVQLEQAPPRPPDARPTVGQAGDTAELSPPGTAPKHVSPTTETTDEIPALPPDP
jgi:pSer/pThr/pTyr-binding forkhead associated (FHA) protein